MSETLHSRNRARIAAGTQSGNNVISKLVRVKADTETNTMRTAVLSGVGLNVTVAVGQQKPIAMNIKQRIIGTMGRQKEEPMGTNYYAVRNRPTTEEPIHIGKSSMGWKFNFQSQNKKWCEPPVVWNTYDQVYEWLYKNTVESDSYVIIDEYDEIISFDDFVALVEKKQSENNPDDFTYSKNVNGYRFCDEEFC